MISYLLSIPIAWLNLALTWFIYFFQWRCSSSNTSRLVTESLGNNLFSQIKQIKYSLTEIINTSSSYIDLRDHALKTMGRWINYKNVFSTGRVKQLLLGGYMNTWELMVLIISIKLHFVCLTWRKIKFLRNFNIAIKFLTQFLSIQIRFET